jgi:hypothetical protein
VNEINQAKLIEPKFAFGDEVYIDASKSKASFVFLPKFYNNITGEIIACRHKSPRQNYEHSCLEYKILVDTHTSMEENIFVSNCFPWIDEHLLERQAKHDKRGT